METIYTKNTVSVTELKKNFSEVLNVAKNAPVAILIHNKPEAYLLSSEYYVKLLEQLEELEDIKLCLKRNNDAFVDVDINKL